MVHYMKLKREPFENIRKGLKTIELRLYDEKRQVIQVGDQIRFKDMDSERLIYAEVIKLHRFSSFNELYSKLPLDKCGYEDVSIAKAEDMEKFYSKEEQAQYGVIGIEITVIESTSI